MEQRIDHDLCIIGGAGHIGLPLGIAFALKELDTVLLDVNEAVLSQISSGVMPFKEDNGEEGLKQSLAMGKLHVSTDPSVISRSKTVIMVIGTPIDEYLNPNFHGIINTIEKYLEFFTPGQILILRSTVYPGTSERLQRYFQQHGKDVKVAFCPERIVEGKALEELKSLPQIVSAFDDATLQSVCGLFQKLTAKKMIRVKPIEAELSKLYTNAWRYIKFSVSNQFYMIAKEKGVDYQAVYNSMHEDYGRNIDLASPGLTAGPCLLKDTMQLSAFNNNQFFLGHAAMLVNEGMPKFMIEQLKREHDLKDKTAGILGMAFKAESDDQRDSLSFKLRKIAEIEFKDVLCHDVYMKKPWFVPQEELIEKSDFIILATPHKQYKDIDPRKYPDKVFVDIWNFWPKNNQA